ncbi:alpha/beta fold hydrolase [Nocardia sp. CDC160]|uniref:alpha/beta fold hydrolase n=1 Tax=Nocardia sp. CDC160 TaxID=3112166 RepID=UPI002DB6ACCA|nr:alpha/beta hydrolase [Nocardia sp. CDC160]MEC3917613.1 alpha/beta hydrolase [Nocardia sp. CDC160]
MTNWLLLRGLTRDQRHWGEFPKRLSAALGSRVVTIDPPGFGTQNARPSPRSIPEIVDDIRARFEPGDEKWSVLGISLGGMMAMNWCARYPREFQRCVLVNTGGPAVFRLRGFNWGVLPVFAGRTLRTDLAHESAVLALTANNPALDVATLARTWARYQTEARPLPASILGQVMAAATFRLPQHIPIPLLILASKADRLAPYTMSERLAQRFAAPLRLHEKAGHDLPLDDADWVCASVADWLTAQGEPRG